jgi:acetamidase/formamidase
MATTHLLPAERVHYKWDEQLEPVLEIDAGDSVVIDTRILTEEQLLPGHGPEAILAIEWERIHALTGPIYVRGAEPGDALEIVVKRLRTGSWGVSWIDPTYGLLQGEFADPSIRFFDLTRPDGQAEFAPGVLIPLSPFLGVMGVAPRGEPRTTYAPGPFGGNLDCKDLVERARLFLPVFVDGALFSTGDAHAVQGDGEICSAIECPATAELEFILHKGRTLRGPQVETDEAIITIGHADELEEAVREAVRFMLDWLEQRYGMSRDEAYILCSLAGDPRINEVVNGNPVVYGARFVLPRRVLENL